MIIFIDLDNTINKLYKGYEQYYNKKYNANISLKRNELTSYFIHQLTGDNEQQEQNRKSEIFNTIGFWENLPMYEDAYDVIQRLYEKHDVFIVTAPWILNIHCYSEKIKWIKNNLPFFDIDKVILTSHKYLLKGDLIIDDFEKHLNESKCEYKIKMNYPFNKHVNALPADNWNEIEKHIYNITGE